MESSIYTAKVDINVKYINGLLSARQFNIGMKVGFELDKHWDDNV